MTQERAVQLRSSLKHRRPIAASRVLTNVEVIQHFRQADSRRVVVVRRDVIAVDRKLCRVTVDVYAGTVRGVLLQVVQKLAILSAKHNNNIKSV